MSEQWAIIGVAIAVALLGLVAAWALYGRQTRVWTRQRRRFREAALNGFYVDALYDIVIVAPTKLLARGFAEFDRIFIDGFVHLIGHATRGLARADDVFDRVIVDGMVNGLAATFSAAGRKLRQTQTGRLQNYVYAAVAGAIVVIGLNLLLRR